MATTVDPADLAPFAAALLEAEGAPPELARQVADSLVLADLRGYGSHGVLRVPMYARMIADGAIDPAATPAVEAETATTARMDGRRAFGQVVGREATRVLVEKAAADGVAAVGVRDATHLGRMGEWGERAADAGLCFLSFVNAQGKGLMVALAGSTDRTLSTNPVTVALPTFDALPYPIVLDAATSQVAYGKVREYESKAAPLPPEWAVAPDGSPETDPTAITDLERGDSAIRPLGGTVSGYKGTGLAVVTELLAGYLSTGPVVGEGDPTEWFSNAATFVAIDPSRFSSPDRMREQAAAFAARFRAADRHPDVPLGPGARGDALTLPGEAEHALERDHRAAGVPLAPRVVNALVERADGHGLGDRVPQAMRG